MFTYRYTALDNEGRSSNGLIEAPDEHQAAETLRSRNLLITSLEMKRESNIAEVLGVGKASPKQVSTLTRQLATMITAGLPLTKALQVLADQLKDGALKKAINQVIRDIDGGISFSKSLEKHPQVFPRLYVSLIRAGEASGNLDKILVKLADSLESQEEFKAKIKGALIYPVIILFAMAGVMTVIMVFVVPQMKQVYESLNADLPAATKLLIAISDLFTTKWYIMVALIAAGIYGYRWYSKTMQGKYMLADLAMKMPVFGKLSIEVQLTQFIETLALLISSGVPILDAMDIAKETLSNIRFQEAVAAISQSVEKGTSLADAIQRQKIFPVIVGQMTMIGEQTGKLDEVLAKVGKAFEDESNNTVKNLSTSLEPIIMIVLGVSVGFLIFSLILPIYGVLNAV